MPSYYCLHAVYAYTSLVSGTKFNEFLSLKMSYYNETLSPETETHLHFYFYFVFLPCDCMRKMYVSMSVRPSVKRVDCDKTIG